MKIYKTTIIIWNTFLRKSQLIWQMWRNDYVTRTVYKRLLGHMRNAARRLSLAALNDKIRSGRPSGIDYDLVWDFMNDNLQITTEKVIESLNIDISIKFYCLILSGDNILVFVKCWNQGYQFALRFKIRNLKFKTEYG